MSGGPVVARAWQALEEVLDPELDQSIVRLGFVAGMAVEGSCSVGTVRLPTF
ncbi:iron-sulfur cluster assembly protein [Thermoflexus sp.]|uniref:iron-sulfur cluster assembly protein n=1 Tax=Thermoflexus sp. TaxID=1969742 RepID=UPI0035E45A40